MRAGRCRAVAVVLWLTLAAVGSPAAQDKAAEAEKFRQFAAELLRHIEPGRSIAVRPFKPVELPISADDANAFNDDLLTALIETSEGRHKFIRLDALRVMIAEKCELQPDECDRMMDTSLRNAGAGILVVGRMRADGDEIKLSYDAYDLEQTTTLASTASRSFTVLRSAAAAMAWDAALAAAGRYLSENTEDLRTLCRGRITFQDTRIQTTLGRYMVSKVADEVHASAQSLLSGRGVILGDAVDDACPAGDRGGGYVLAGNYWPLGEQLSVRLALRNDLGQEVNVWSGQIRRATLPDGLAVQPTEEGEKGGRGSALLDAETSEDEALLRARMQARLRAIGNATNRAVPVTGPVPDSIAARAILAAMSDAVTYDEEWQGARRVKRQGGEVLETELRGRVRALGGAGAPPIEVSLQSDVIVMGDPLVLTVTSPVKAYLGLYAWGADDRIVRLLPESPSQPVVVQPNATLTLPPGGDGLTSGPLPGSPLNTEALVVVASSKPIDFVALAAAVPGIDVGATMNAAIEVNRFNEEVRKLDQQTVTVRYVPYTVRAQ